MTETHAAATPAPHQQDCSSEAIALLSRGLVLYRDLEEMSRGLAGAIDARETERLHELLGARGVLIEEVTRVSDRLASLGTRASLLGACPASTRDEMEHLFDELAMLAGRIRAHDERALGRLTDVRGSVASSLSEVSTARSAVSAYAGAAPPAQPRFQDENG